VTEKFYEWENDIPLPDFEALYKLLMANAIPTKSLKLRSKNIEDGPAAKIGDVLKANTNLTVLDLSTNYIGLEGAKKISEALMVNTTLTSLNVRWNVMKDEGAKLISESLKFNTALTSLNLENNEVGDKMKSALRKAWGSRKGEISV